MRPTGHSPSTSLRARPSRRDLSHEQLRREEREGAIKAQLQYRSPGRWMEAGGSSAHQRRSEEDERNLAWARDLDALQRLRATGVLSEAEFEQQKGDILRRRTMREEEVRS